MFRVFGSKPYLVGVVTGCALMACFSLLHEPLFGDSTFVRDEGPPSFRRLRIKNKSGANITNIQIKLWNDETTPNPTQTITQATPNSGIPANLANNADLILDEARGGIDWPDVLARKVQVLITVGANARSRTFVSRTMIGGVNYFADNFVDTATLGVYGALDADIDSYGSHTAEGNLGSAAIEIHGTP